MVFAPKKEMKNRTITIFFIPLRTQTHNIIVYV